MLELNVFKEIAGSEKYHSCILATYSLDFYFLEQRIIRILRSKGIRNISVIADGSVLEDCMGQMIHNVKKISSLYSLSSVITKGAFHPKLYMFFGDEAILLIIGSGNLTAGGMGKNHEAFISFIVDKDNQTHLPILLQAWYYLETICSEQKGISSQQVQWIKEYCTYLKSPRLPKLTPDFFNIDTKISAAFLSNLNGGIWENLKRLLSNPDAIHRITIAAPFFDKGGELLRQMLEHFSNAAIDIYIQEKGTLLPIDYGRSSKVQFYSWGHTNAALTMTFKRFERFQHSKLFHFEGVDEEFLLMGSPNATNAAFLNNTVIQNYETAILLHQGEVSWLSELCLNGEKVILDPKSFVETKSRDNTTNPSRSFIYKIQGIDKVNRDFKIYINKSVTEKQVRFVLFDCFGDKLVEFPVDKSGKELIFRVHTKSEAEQVVYGQFQDEAGFQVSNSQIVNNVSSIETLHPSPENRKVHRLIEKMMSDKYSGLDLFELYEIIYNEKAAEQQRKEKQVGRKITNPKERGTRPITFEEALELAQKEESVLQLKQFEPIQLYDTYLSKLEQLMQRKEDEDIDDEEDGNIKDGRGREESEKARQPRPFSSENAFNNTRERVRKVFICYLNSLSEVIKDADYNDGTYDIFLSDYAFFLLSISHLLDITGKEYSYKEKDGSIETKVLFPFTGAMDQLASFDSIALNVIGKYLLFLHHAKGNVNYSEEYDRKKLQFLKEAVYVTILLCIATIKENWKKNSKEKDHKWLLLLLLNSVGTLDMREIKIAEKIKSAFKTFDITHLELEETIETLTLLYSDCLNIMNEIKVKEISSNYLYTVQFGYCYAVEYIPKGTKWKFLRLSNPGFTFDGKEFLFYKLYDWNNLNFLSSYKGAVGLNKVKETIAKRKNDEI